MGALEYSDTMKITRGAIDLWDLMARKRNGMKSSTKKIRRLMRLTGKNTGLQETLPAIISKQKLAMKAYRKLKKQAVKERESFGKRLIKARAAARHTTVDAQECQLRNALGQRKLAQQVKRLTGKQRGAPIQSVTAPDKNDSENRIECHDKATIKEAFSVEGTKRFSQTIGTPLTKPDFISQVGYIGELEGTEEILNGTFIPEPGMDQYTAQFLKQLKMEPAVRNSTPITKVISTQSYQESWKKM